MKKMKAISQSQTLLIMGVVVLVLIFFVGIPFLNSCKQKLMVSKLQMINSGIAEANFKAFIRLAELTGEFNVSLSESEIARLYFEPYLPVKQICVEDQAACWGATAYKDLKNKSYVNNIGYSFVLNNGALFGFSKNSKGRNLLFVDIDGKNGKNTLGKDVFVYSIYNSNQEPICENSEFSNVYIKNGLHYGGFDECGIPHDVYDSFKLLGVTVKDGCNIDAQSYSDGIGVGAACFAVLKNSNWAIDKKYPW